MKISTDCHCKVRLRFGSGLIIGLFFLYPGIVVDIVSPMDCVVEVVPIPKRKKAL